MCSETMATHTHTHCIPVPQGPLADGILKLWCLHVLRNYGYTHTHTYYTHTHTNCIPAHRVHSVS